jgi:hypothetical protein
MAAMNAAENIRGVEHIAPPSHARHINLSIFVYAAFFNLKPYILGDNDGR